MLKGARRVLASLRPDVVQIELIDAYLRREGAFVSEVVELMGAFEFEMYSLGKGGCMSKLPLSVAPPSNAFFFRGPSMGP